MIYDLLLALAVGGVYLLIAGTLSVAAVALWMKVTGRE